MELETSWIYVRNSRCFLLYLPYLTSDQTANTYLESAQLTGSNNTNKIETILQPFYGIRNIFYKCA